MSTETHPIGADSPKDPLTAVVLPGVDRHRGLFDVFVSAQAEIPDSDPRDIGADLNGSWPWTPYIDVVVVQDALVSPGSSDAVGRMYHEQGAKLWRSLLAYTGDREIASDAMAEAFAQALGRGDAIGSPDRWVWRTAFRIAAGQLKSRSRHVPISSRDSTPYEMPEPAIDFIRALAKLSPKQRAVAILHLYADYRTRDVASILGISQATVRVHLSQARRRLRSMLEDNDA